MGTQTTTDFTGAVTQWLAIHSIGRKPSSQKFNREIAEIILEKWHEPKISIEAISADDILFFAQSVAHYCPSRWNAIVACVRSFSPHGKLLKRKPIRLKNFTPPEQSEFKTLLAECDAARKGCNVGLVVRFLCLTGLRISEAKAIRWENIFNDRVEVPSVVIGNKASKRRSIPLLDGLSDVLERLMVISDGSEFVLPRANSRKAIESACDRAGIERMSFHCFRHYFATRCIESGVDIPTVSRWLGHSDGGALLSKTYFHLLNSHSREMAAKVKIVA